MSTQITRAILLYEEAGAAENQGNINRAEVLYVESKEIFMQQGGVHLVDAANSMNAMALMKTKHADYHGALRAAEKSVQIMVDLVGKTPNRKADEIYLRSWIIIGNIHRHLTHYDQAEQMLQRALDHALHAFGSADEQTTSIFSELSLLYRQMGKLEEAERL